MVAARRLPITTLWGPGGVPPPGRLAILGLSALLSLSPLRAFAQPALEARLGVGLDVLARGTSDSESRALLEGSLRPELHFASQHGRIGYDLDGGRYNGEGDWSFLQHTLEASYRVGFGSQEKVRLFAGGGVSWRRNGAAWSDANYDTRKAFANFEWQPRGSLVARTGYRLVDRSFAQIPELNQLEQDLFASANVSLPSRTTLIAESHFGWKSYADGAGRGRGAGRRRAAAPPLALTDGGGVRVRQWNVLAHVAQGLSERTGAWVRGFVRRASGQPAPAVVITPAGFFDDGVYDDPFASDATAFSAGLKHILRGGAALRIVGAWQRRDFAAIPGASSRRDRIRQLGAAIALPVADTQAFAVLLEMDYAFTGSRSNDASYDYRDHAIELAMSLQR